MSQQTETPLGMILEKTKFSISKKFVKSLWRLKNEKKNCLQKIFCIFECLLPQNPSNQISQLSRFFRTKRKTKKIKKLGALGNYSCLKMISKLALQYIFQKNMQILETWKPTEDMKFRLEFFCTCHSTYELNIM